jgi:hypothetical protein
MIDTLNLIFISEFGPQQKMEGASYSIEQWLRNINNYNRLQRECEKIWSQYYTDPQYDIERAFRLVATRLCGVVSADEHQ